MAKYGRAKNTARRQSISRAPDDTKFYIKFKDPRTKTQIFYYFDEEDIFDPCIPLNDSDIVYESGQMQAVPTREVSRPKPAPAPPPKKTAIKIQKQPPVDPTNLRAHSSTLQVREEDAIKFDSDSSVSNSSQGSDVFDDSFEDVGYMTAMDIKYDPNHKEEETKPKPVQKSLPKVETVIEAKLELIEDEPKKEIRHPSRQFEFRTALEANDSREEILAPITMSKAEFESVTKGSNDNPYQNWIDTHLKQTLLEARLISPAEFRLLKRVIGLNKK